MSYRRISVREGLKGWFPELNSPGFHRSLPHAKQSWVSHVKPWCLFPHLESSMIMTLYLILTLLRGECEGISGKP